MITEAENVIYMIISDESRSGIILLYGIRYSIFSRFSSVLPLSFSFYFFDQWRWILFCCSNINNNSTHSSLIASLSFSSVSPTEAAAEILEAPDLHIDEGSTLRLECKLKRATESPLYVFWWVFRVHVAILELSKCYLSAPSRWSGITRIGWSIMIRRMASPYQRINWPRASWRCGMPRPDTVGTTPVHLPMRDNRVSTCTCSKVRTTKVTLDIRNWFIARTKACCYTNEVPFLGKTWKKNCPQSETGNIINSYEYGHGYQCIIIGHIW